MKTVVIIPAAGSGKRYSSKKNKLLEKINSKPVIVKTLEKISSVDEIESIIICTSEELKDQINLLIDQYDIKKVNAVILGGKTRKESVFKGLDYAKKHIKKIDLALIHDAARPFIEEQVIKEAIIKASERGAAIVGVPAKDTIKKVDICSNKVLSTPLRNELWNIQTPQVFNFEKIYLSHVKFKNENFTDDSAVAEKAGMSVYLVEGSYKNIKITTQEDIIIANAFDKSS